MSDRLLAPFRTIVRYLVGNEVVGPRVDYLAAYPCVAVAQNGDGTLELQPDDPRIPPAKSVPIRYGVPGVSAQIAPGARVMLRFAAGDPSKPYAEVWESASVTALTVTASAIKLGGPGATQAIPLGDNLMHVLAYAADQAQIAAVGPLAPMKPAFLQLVTDLGYVANSVSNPTGIFGPLPVLSTAAKSQP